MCALVGWSVNPSHWFGGLLCIGLMQQAKVGLVGFYTLSSFNKHLLYLGFIHAVIHSVRCAVCNASPIIGLRYQCLKVCVKIIILLQKFSLLKSIVCTLFFIVLGLQ